MTFRVDFVTGATPDKWVWVWREREREPSSWSPSPHEEQEVGVGNGGVDMALVRLPVDRDGLHLIPLYDEQPVAVLGTDHVLTLLDEVTAETSPTSTRTGPGPRPATPSRRSPPAPACSSSRCRSRGCATAVT